MAYIQCHSSKKDIIFSDFWTSQFSHPRPFTRNPLRLTSKTQGNKEGIHKRQQERRRRFRRVSRRNRKEAIAHSAPLSPKKYLRRLRRIAERQKSLHEELAKLSHKQEILLQRVIQSKESSPILTRGRRNIEQSLKTLQEANEEDISDLFNEDHPKQRVRRAATAYKSRTWPYGVIPYVIQANFTSQFMLIES